MLRLLRLDLVVQPYLARDVGELPSPSCTGSQDPGPGYRLDELHKARAQLQFEPLPGCNRFSSGTEHFLCFMTFGIERLVAVESINPILCAPTVLLTIPTAQILPFP